jgi:HrpA-like RNA helicase
VSSTNAEHLKKSYEDRQKLRASKSSFATIQSNRSKLPSFQLREEVCKMVKAHQIILVSGETGCGKTTQVPQFLLDDPEIGPSCRMIITQPRRLSAITVAERISAERDEKIGTTVGYNIRFESEVSNSTQVLFVTPGVLLRKLQSDPELNEYTHILIDEAHERDRFTEFLFIILKGKNISSTTLSTTVWLLSVNRSLSETPVS